MSRLSAAASLLTLMTLISACGETSPGRSNARRARPTGDPHTEAALLRIARQFNQEYAANQDGPVYDRWDAESQQVISRAEYIRRHQECATAPGAAVIEAAAPAAGGYWTVRYSISGTQLTDFWHYQNGRWRFDLLRSNPDALRLYRLPAAKYFAAVGCSTHK